MVATPIGSLLVTLWLSQAQGVGWWWNSRSELEVAATFASVGILFYTVSFAVLEIGLMVIMVLALQVIKRYEEGREKRQQELIDKGVALALEAERRRQGTGDSLEQAIEKLRAEGWQPPPS
jgi:hypothetical protein